MHYMPKEAPLSLYHLLNPEVLADPYPLYARLRTEAPVLWDPYLHAWIVTRYEDVITVLTRFSADRTPSPDHFRAIGAPEVGPIATVMVKQMLFQDGAAHSRLRKLASGAFVPSRVRALWKSDPRNCHTPHRRNLRPWHRPVRFARRFRGAIAGDCYRRNAGRTDPKITRSSKIGQ